MYRVPGKQENAVFEATLREIEYLANYFDTITWMGYTRGVLKPGLGRIPNKANLKLVLFPAAVGGNSFFKKLKIIPFIPKLLVMVLNELARHEIIHTRGPSTPALLTLLISFVWKKKYWHKYAGNWRQESPPLSYRIQRSLLRKSKDFIAVNGRLATDPENIVTLENPCFTEAELMAANDTARNFSDKHNLLFVGRLEWEKGILALMQAYKSLSNRFDLLVVGHGKDEEEVHRFARENRLPVRFYGMVGRDELNKLYAHSHFLVLPTVASEGFPKVLAEAAGFGCIPVTTGISSIGDYVTHGVNGLILGQATPESIHFVLTNLPNAEHLHAMAESAKDMAKLYTYSRYWQRLKEYLNFD